VDIADSAGVTSGLESALSPDLGRRRLASFVSGCIPLQLGRWDWL